MPKYRAIVVDSQIYDFIIEVPEGLSEEERDEFIYEYLGDNRDTCWRSGEEVIEALDPV